MSALALVCGVSVACSSNTSANVNTNSANTNISQENTSSQNNINNNNTNAKITSDKAKEIASCSVCRSSTSWWLPTRTTCCSTS